MPARQRHRRRRVLFARLCVAPAILVIYSAASIPGRDVRDAVACGRFKPTGIGADVFIKLTDDERKRPRAPPQLDGKLEQSARY